MPMQQRTIKQSNLTAECWNIQVWGIVACTNCEFRCTSECGGQEIRKKLKNEKGLDVPID